MIYDLFDNVIVEQHIEKSSTGINQRQTQTLTSYNIYQKKQEETVIEKAEKADAYHAVDLTVRGWIQGGQAVLPFQYDEEHDERKKTTYAYQNRLFADRVSFSREEDFLRRKITEESHTDFYKSRTVRKDVVVRMIKDNGSADTYRFSEDNAEYNAWGQRLSFDRIHEISGYSDTFTDVMDGLRESYTYEYNNKGYRTLEREEHFQIKEGIHTKTQRYDREVTSFSLTGKDEIVEDRSYGIFENDAGEDEERLLSFVREERLFNSYDRVEAIDKYEYVVDEDGEVQENDYMLEKKTISYYEKVDLNPFVRDVITEVAYARPVESARYDFPGFIGNFFEQLIAQDQEGLLPENDRELKTLLRIRRTRFLSLDTWIRGIFQLERVRAIPWIKFLVETRPINTLEDIYVGFREIQRRFEDSLILGKKQFEKVTRYRVRNSDLYDGELTDEVYQESAFLYREDRTDTPAFKVSLLSEKVSEFKSYVGQVVTEVVSRERKMSSTYEEVKQKVSIYERGQVINDLETSYEESYYPKKEEEGEFLNQLSEEELVGALTLEELYGSLSLEDLFELSDQEDVDGITIWINALTEDEKRQVFSRWGEGSTTLADVASWIQDILTGTYTTIDYDILEGVRNFFQEKIDTFYRNRWLGEENEQNRAEDRGLIESYLREQQGALFKAYIINSYDNLSEERRSNLVGSFYERERNLLFGGIESYNERGYVPFSLYHVYQGSYLLATYTGLKEFKEQEKIYTRWNPRGHAVAWVQKDSFYGRGDRYSEIQQVIKNGLPIFLLGTSVVRRRDSFLTSSGQTLYSKERSHEVDLSSGRGDNVKDKERVILRQNKQGRDYQSLEKTSEYSKLDHRVFRLDTETFLKDVRYDSNGRQIYTQKEIEKQMASVLPEVGFLITQNSVDYLLEPFQNSTFQAMTEEPMIETAHITYDDRGRLLVRDTTLDKEVVVSEYYSETLLGADEEETPEPMRVTERSRTENRYDTGNFGAETGAIETYTTILHQTEDGKVLKASRLNRTDIKTEERAKVFEEYYGNYTTTIAGYANAIAHDYIYDQKYESLNEDVLEFNIQKLESIEDLSLSDLEITIDDMLQAEGEELTEIAEKVTKVNRLRITDRVKDNADKVRSFERRLRSFWVDENLLAVNGGGFPFLLTADTSVSRYLTKYRGDRESETYEETINNVWISKFGWHTSSNVRKQIKKMISDYFFGKESETKMEERHTKVRGLSIWNGDLMWRAPRDRLVYKRNKFVTDLSHYYFSENRGYEEGVYERKPWQKVYGYDEEREDYGWGISGQKTGYRYTDYDIIRKNRAGHVLESDRETFTQINAPLPIRLTDRMMSIMIDREFVTFELGRDVGFDDVWENGSLRSYAILGLMSSEVLDSDGDYEYYDDNDYFDYHRQYTTGAGYDQFGQRLHYITYDRGRDGKTKAIVRKETQYTWLRKDGDVLDGGEIVLGGGTYGVLDPSNFKDDIEDSSVVSALGYIADGGLFDEDTLRAQFSGLPEEGEDEFYYFSKEMFIDEDSYAEKRTSESYKDDYATGISVDEDEPTTLHEEGDEYELFLDLEDEDLAWAPSLLYAGTSYPYLTFTEGERTDQQTFAITYLLS